MVLAADEQWAMADSGAGVSGMNVTERASSFMRFVQQAAKRNKCIAANGGEMLTDNKIELRCELDGHEMNAKFADLSIQCPIPSVRRIIRKGNDIDFTEDGGFIQHRTSRRKIDFVEQEGAYFINR